MSYGLYFSDNFNRADTAYAANPGTVANGWTQLVASTWKISSNAAVSANAAGNYKSAFLVQDAGAGLPTVKLRVTSTAWGGSGYLMPLGHYNGSTGDAIYGGVTHNYMIIWQVVGGVQSDLCASAAPALTSGHSYIAELEIVQTNATTTTCTLKVFDTADPATAIATVTGTTTAASLQTTAGTLKYGMTALNGWGFDTYEIYAPALVSGTTSLTSTSATTITLGTTAATGGTSPYTYQWYRSTTSGFTPAAGNALAGKTATTCADATATRGVMYYYKVVATDSAGSPASVTSNQTAAAIPGNDLVVGFIGDSITANTPSGGNPPPTECANVLRSRWQYKIVTAVNEGHGGARTVNFQNDQAYMTTALTNFAAAGVTIVHVMLGSNDSQDVTPAIYNTRLTNIVQTLQGAGYTVVVSYPPYYLPSVASMSEATIATLQSYQEQIDAVCAATGAIVGDTVAWQLFADNTALLSDGIHPTAAGAVVLAECWAWALTKAALPAVGNVKTGTTYADALYTGTMASGSGVQVSRIGI